MKAKLRHSQRIWWLCNCPTRNKGSSSGYKLHRQQSESTHKKQKVLVVIMWAIMQDGIILYLCCFLLLNDLKIN